MTTTASEPPPLAPLVPEPWPVVLERAQAALGMTTPPDTLRNETLT